MIEITREAMAQITPQQRDQIAYIAGPHARKVRVTGACWGLPAEYVSVEIEYQDGHTISGGIDADGRMST